MLRPMCSKLRNLRANHLIILTQIIADYTAEGSKPSARPKSETSKEVEKSFGNWTF